MVQQELLGPILYVSQGMLGQDITAYGFLGSQTDPAKQAGGGAILLGSGFTSPCTPPIISLSDSFLDMQIANGSMPQARYMRDVVYRQDQGAFYIWNGSIWVCFRGPFSYLPQGSTLVTDQFFTATDTQTIYVNDPEAQWVPLGPWTGSNFQGFDTLFLLTSDYSLLANLYLGTVYATNLKYHSSLSSFDAIDDLEVLKKIKTISDKEGKDVIDPESITYLKDEGGFYDAAKVDGWHISVQKKLLERIEMLETKLSQLVKINDLKATETS